MPLDALLGLVDHHQSTLFPDNTNTTTADTNASTTPSTATAATPSTTPAATAGSATVTAATKTSTNVPSASTTGSAPPVSSDDTCGGRGCCDNDPAYRDEPVYDIWQLVPPVAATSFVLGMACLGLATRKRKSKAKD